MELMYMTETNNALFSIVIVILVILVILVIYFFKKGEAFTILDGKNKKTTQFFDTKTHFVYYPRGMGGAAPLHYNNGYKGDYIDELYVLHKKTEPERLKNSIIYKGPIPQASENPKNFYEF
jgi:hypothetical protein